MFSMVVICFGEIVERVWEMNVIFICMEYRLFIFVFFVYGRDKGYVNYERVFVLWKIFKYDLLVCLKVEVGRFIKSFYRVLYIRRMFVKRYIAR